MNVPLRLALLHEINSRWRRSRRWIPKSELETFSKKLGFLADNGTRRLRELSSKKNQDPLIDKLMINKTMHYRKKVEKLICDEA